MARRRKSSDSGIAILAVIIIGLIAAFIKLYKKSPAAALSVLAVIIGGVALFGSSIETKPTPTSYTPSSFTTPASSPSAYSTPVLSTDTANKESGISNKYYRSTTTSAGGDGYTNVDGEQVSSPVFSKSAPAGATAQCRDGSYSFSRHRRGTCSHHGGVARWL
jgi:hypothetical protein